VNKTDKEGINSFWIGCYYGHGGVMKVLAEAGADVLSTDKFGLNVLHLAAKKNYLNIIKMLIISKYPLNIQTNKGQTAVSFAAKHGNL
jgi:ankyrin repeat protein